MDMDARRMLDALLLPIKTRATMDTPTLELERAADDAYAALLCMVESYLRQKTGGTP